MRTDAFGVVHPTTDDEPDLVSALHIAECGECRKRLGDGVFAFAVQIATAYENSAREAARHKK